jgi:hypothetical protein
MVRYHYLGVKANQRVPREIKRSDILSPAFKLVYRVPSTNTIKQAKELIKKKDKSVQVLIKKAFKPILDSVPKKGFTVDEVKKLMKKHKVQGVSKVTAKNKGFYLRKVQQTIKAKTPLKLPAQLRIKSGVPKTPQRMSMEKTIAQGCGIRGDQNVFVTGDKELDKAITSGINSLVDLCDDPAGIYFCRQNLGIPRKKMPQLKGDIFARYSDIRKFLNDLLKKGIKIEEKQVEVCALKATQSNLEGKKVRRFIETMRMAGGNLDRKRPSKNLPPTFFNYLINLGKPLIISNDYYILDGHHRWAAILAWDFIDKKDKELKLVVKMVDLPMQDLYKRAIKSKLTKVETTF